MILTMSEIKQRLMELNNWHVEGNAIKKVYEFETYLETLAFANKIARIAEEENHHPDILIQYKKVTITSTTHSENGISEKDFSLAKKIDGE